MNYNIPPQIQSFVNSQIANGIFASEAEFITAALDNLKHELESQQSYAEWVGKAAQKGRDDIAGGRIMSAEDAKLSLGSMKQEWLKNGQH